MTEELKQKAEEYAEKECKNCACRCDKPNMFKRLSNKMECHAYFRTYEGYIAGATEETKELNKKLSQAESEYDKMFWQKNEIISNLQEQIEKTNKCLKMSKPKNV